jgi:hypothetical protein
MDWHWPCGLSRDTGPTNARRPSWLTTVSRRKCSKRNRVRSSRTMLSMYRTTVTCICQIEGKSWLHKYATSTRRFVHRMQHWYTRPLTGQTAEQTTSGCCSRTNSSLHLPNREQDLVTEVCHQYGDGYIGCCMATSGPSQGKQQS